jgi:hypothetical protein
VHRLLALAAGLLAGVALVALLRRRRASREAAPAGPDPRAEELRRTLAGSREPAEPAAAPGPDADAARRSVHDEARGVIEEMERSGEP